MEQENKLRMKTMRKICSAPGLATSLYYIIMNAAVMFYMFAGTVAYAAYYTIGGIPFDENDIMQKLSNSGAGYFIAIFLGLLILLLWKKPRFFKNAIFTRGKPMTVGTFLALFSIFMGTQVLFQWGATALEIILNMFDLSFLSGIESATGGSDTFSMFLYIGFGAPIAEELLFRGLVLRSLQPMGKKIAIFMSAVMFGLYHANAIQIPYAFLVGLVLGYVAIEYSIGWAMLLHMFNNLILADTLPRILPGLGGNLLTMAITYSCLLAAIIVLLVKIKSVIAYFKENRNEPGSLKAFVTAPGMIAFFVLIFIMTIFTTVLLIGPVA